ncbi:hypothetical protein Tco_0479908, partial [Tanacetum coccineum]
DLMMYDDDEQSKSVALNYWARSAIYLVRLSSISSVWVYPESILDIVVIEGLLMKKDIDETGHVMIGHEVGQLKQMQVDH